MRLNILNIADLIRDTNGSSELPPRYVRYVVLLS